MYHARDVGSFMQLSLDSALFPASLSIPFPTCRLLVTHSAPQHGSIRHAYTVILLPITICVRWTMCAASGVWDRVQRVNSRCAVPATAPIKTGYVCSKYSPCTAQCEEGYPLLHLKACTTHSLPQRDDQGLRVAAHFVASISDGNTHSVTGETAV